MSRRSQLSIVYVWDADYPWDVRTEKICRALTDAGHRVTIVARNREWRAEAEQLREGMVRRMRPWRAVGHRIDGALGFPAFFSPRWRRLISRTVRETAADLIIVRDLPLCPAAIAIGRRHRIPVMLDMAENYPAMMQDRRHSNRNALVDAVVRNPKIVARTERYCVHRVAHILTVVDESSERLVAMGVDPSRLTVVSNTPPRMRADHPPRTVRPDGADLTLVYLGLLETARGVAEVIDAVAILRREDRLPIRAVIVGGGRDAEAFRERARIAGVLDAGVSFLGTLPHADALRVVAEGDIGIVPHHATESWNTTIPNKLFDYMAAGLAVVTSDAIPAARIVRQTQCGEVFASGNAASLASALRRLGASGCTQSRGEAGRQAVLDTYHWERDVDALLGSVRAVVQGPRTGQ